MFDPIPRHQKPTWNTPARIDGLPATNWKKRTGVTFAGTMAECIARWLNLPPRHQRECTVGWGPLDGQHGRMESCAIAAYIRENGLPPKLATERGGQPSPEVLERLVSMPRYDPAPNADHPAKGAHGTWSTSGFTKRVK